jgi:autotransporter-associated beta strand protein
VRSGIFGVASGHSATVGEIALSAGAIVRIAGSAGPSVLYVGPGGIRAAGGDIQVKFNTGAQDATLDLSGDFTATGNVTVSNAGYGGPNLNVVLLNGARTFRIAEGTQTTVAADLGGSGSLVKTGLGTLSLLGTCAADPAGGTEVNEGVLTVRGQLAGGAVTVKGSGVLSGDGNVGSDVAVQSGGRVAPGTGLVGSADPAVLNFSGGLTLGAGTRYVAEIAGPGTNDRLAVSGPLVTSGTVAVVLAGYVPVAGDSFDLVDAALRSGQPSFDFAAAVLPAGLAWDTSQFTADGVVRVVEGGAGPFASWAAGYGLTGADAATGADPDRDGVVNGMEFAVGSDPVRGGSVPQSFPWVHELAGGRALTFTVPVRAGAVFAASGSRQTAQRDGVSYVVEASDDLQAWDRVVVTKLGAAESAAVQAQLSLPSLETGWEWATFRTDGVAGVDPADYIRLRVP